MEALESFVFVSHQTIYNYLSVRNKMPSVEFCVTCALALYVGTDRTACNKSVYLLYISKELHTIFPSVSLPDWHHIAPGIKIWSELCIGSLHIIFLTFICPCIASMFLKFNQQDATFSRSIYFYRLFYNSTEFHLIHGSSRQQYWFDNTWRSMYSFLLLMMGGGTAWNKYSNL